MEIYMLTTFDNPYDPFDDFDSWYAYDKDHHYDSCELLDRFAKTSDQLTYEENIAEQNDAITRIIKLNPELYTRVKQKNT